MAYTFTVNEKLKVIVELDGNKIDEVGAFESAESANYWATEIAKKYDENPTYVYPGEEPEAESEVVKA